MRPFSKTNIRMRARDIEHVTIPCRVCRTRVQVRIKDLRMMGTLKCPFCGAPLSGRRAEGKRRASDGGL